MQCKCSHWSSPKTLQQTFRVSEIFIGAGGLDLPFYVLCEKQSSSTVSFSGTASVWCSTCSECSALLAAPRLPFKALCPRNDQVSLVCEGNEVLFGNNKIKMENKILASPWFCLGFKFVKQSLWVSFQVAEATLEQLQKHSTKMKNPASELKPRRWMRTFFLQHT